MQSTKYVFLIAWKNWFGVKNQWCFGLKRVTKIRIFFHKMSNANVNYIAKVRSGTIFVDGPEEVKEEIAFFFFFFLRSCKREKTF